MDNKKLNLAIANGRDRVMSFRWKVIAAMDVGTFHPKYEKTVHDIVHNGISARVTSGILVDSDIHLQLLNLLKYDNNRTN